MDIVQPVWTELRAGTYPPLKPAVREYRVTGMRRSGHHAIIDWLASHFPQGEMVYHVIGHLRDARIARQGESPRMLNILNPENVYPETMEVGFIRDLWDFRCPPAESRPQYMAILRDPYNLFASIVKKWGKSRINQEGQIFLWIRWAEELLGITSKAPEGTVIVLYNQWFSDETYRQKLEKALYLPEVNAPVPAGHSHIGSSFDGKDVKTTDMRVLDRWREFGEDKSFRSIFKNRVLNQLALKIFPQTAQMAIGAMELPA